MWEDVYRGYDDLDSLIEMVQTHTKATKKRKRDRSYDDDDAEIDVLACPGSTDVVLQLTADVGSRNRRGSPQNTQKKAEIPAGLDPNLQIGRPHSSKIRDPKSQKVKSLN